MSATAVREDAAVERLDVSVHTIPTDAPEADGTLSWDSTTIVIVEATAAGERGLGYTYGEPAAGALVEAKLAGVVEGMDASSPPAAWRAMRGALRNAGRPGVGMMAVSAVDTALWDLKARLLGVPLCDLLGAVREAVPVYGSGGFTSYDTARLCEQLAGWVEQGIPRVKMKVGSDPGADPLRVRRARQAIGDAPELFVDANGAYERQQALGLAAAFREEARVSWLEEPVSSDDLEGLRLVRDRAPAGMAVAAGEYACEPVDFRRLLEAGAVDVLQADITRCGGVTGLLGVDALARAFQRPLSLHCAPALHTHAALALDRLVHLEYFHDHVRIEEMLFDGVPALRDGALVPDRARPGCGLELKRRTS
ncbi:MAG: Mandelate racemase/muconate lactonizing enzyme-like protein [Solirubrobacterales bacterium]|nr:Mandelate racemase/muconate lactonizing enzyme-like protein [Solirubrobacterales bacterium]